MVSIRLVTPERTLPCLLPRVPFRSTFQIALPTLGSQARRWVLEVAAVAAYHAQQDFPIVDLLLCDDADQFKRLTEELALLILLYFVLL